MGKSDALRERTMRYSIYDGALWAIMYNMGFLFLTPFAVALNAPLSVIAALNALPAFLEGIGQKASTYFGWFGWTRKGVFTYSVLLESIVWLMLSAVAFLAWGAFDSGAVNFLTIALASCIFLLEGTSTPAWFAIMGDVVPENIRASWFGARSRLYNATGLVALLAAGVFMDSMQADPLLGFAALFLAAFAARVISAYFVHMHWDPQPRSVERKDPPAGFLKYLFGLMLLVLSINIAVPYITVYMLKMLGFDYATFSAIMAMTVLMNILAYPHWGRLVDKYGSKIVMVSTAALSALPILIWAYVTEPLLAAFAALLGGLFWSGTVISTFNYVYESTEPQARMNAKGNASLFYGAGTRWA